MPTPPDPATEYMPMPPDRHFRDGQLQTVQPDRCPAGHRVGTPGVQWTISAPHPGQTWWEYRCYACKPVRGAVFRAAADLYDDDLSWWHHPWQAAQRARLRAYYLARDHG